MVEKPEWIATLDGKSTPFPIAFKDILGQKDLIQSMMLLWTNNSYYVNIEKRYLIINGGRRIVPGGLNQFTDVCICYARRVQTQLGVNQELSENVEQSISYLLGFEGMLNGEKREILLHISEDGSMWAWKSKR